MKSLRALLLSKTAPAQSSPDRSFAMGDHARDAAHWAEAAHFYAEGLTLAPNAWRYRVQLGHCLKEQGHHKEALTAYLEAAALAPDDADLMVQLGHISKLLSDSTAATRYYKEALRLGSHDHHALHHLDQAAKQDPALADGLATIRHSGRRIRLQLMRLVDPGWRGELMQLDFCPLTFPQLLLRYSKPADFNRTESTTSSSAK